MFARKNSLVLTVFWVVLLLTGLFWYFKDAGRLNAIRTENTKLTNELKQSQNEIKRLTLVEATYEKLQSKWRETPKKIIAADEPSFSLSYINWMMSQNNINIYFDFVLNDKKKLHDHTKFIYTLSGEGFYKDIYQLLWHLTYGPILYKIHSVTLKRTDLESDLLKFNVKIEGFTTGGQASAIEDFSQLNLTEQKNPAPQKDIFNPLLRPQPVVVKVSQPPKPQLPPKLPGQIDVEKASLKAVTQNSIFIEEGASGLVELKIGDPVYLGRLVRIDQNTNQAEFLLTKFGVTQRKTLSIDIRK